MQNDRAGIVFKPLHLQHPEEYEAMSPSEKLLALMAYNGILFLATKTLLPDHQCEFKPDIGELD